MSDGRGLRYGFGGLGFAGSIKNGPGEHCQTAWHTTTLENRRAAAYQILLLACYAWKMLDGT